jgi:hypothetical protein
MVEGGLFNNLAKSRFYPVYQPINQKTLEKSAGGEHVAMIRSYLKSA